MIELPLDVRGIRRIIPHRYPMLLIDQVVECEAGSHAVALKNVTTNEPFFQGHFPDRPVMPGVLIVEAMAQTSGILCYATAGRPGDDTYFLLVAVDKARFRRMVVPGDQLRLEVRLKRRIKTVWRYDAKAFVDQKLVASTELMCAAGQ